MPEPPRRTTFPFRPIGPAPKGRNRPATSFNDNESCQQQEVNGITSDDPAAASLGEAFGRINVDGSMRLSSPGRYVHRIGDGPTHRFSVPFPGPSYPPGQGPLVPNNSPASDAEFPPTVDDDYKDDATNDEKIKDLSYVANGRHLRGKKQQQRQETSSLDMGKGKELLQFLQQEADAAHSKKIEQKPFKTFKKKTEVNWFTTRRSKQVKVNLSSTPFEKERELFTNENTLVDDGSNIDTDLEGGVATAV